MPPQFTEATFSRSLHRGLQGRQRGVIVGMRPDFWDVFAGRVISCRVGLCKPEPAIYAHLLETYALDPRETVFIDDLDVNLATAAKFGIRTIRFEHPAQCAAALRRLGLE